jgi:hypothetical protein
MLPLIALLALGTMLIYSGKSSTGPIKVNPGDVYRITVQVLGAQDHQQIESMYRLGMSQVAQIGTLIWDGNNMVVQLQYLQPSTITLGEMRAGTTSINVLKAELLGHAAPPVSPTSAAGGWGAIGKAVSRQRMMDIARRAIASGNRVTMMNAAALAERAGHVRIAAVLAKRAMNTGALTTPRRSHLLTQQS